MKVSEDIGIDSSTACDVFQWLREVCTTKLLQTPIVLGVQTKNLRLTRVCFAGNLRYWTHTHVDAHTHIYKNTWLMWKKLLLLQYHRGRPPQQEVWVFGIVDTSQQPALGFMQIVQRRDAATLLHIIQAHINPGTENRTLTSGQHTAMWEHCCCSPHSQSQLGIYCSRWDSHATYRVILE